MNPDYARHAFPILFLGVLLLLLLWSVGFGIYLNRIGSHGWPSTRRLLRTFPPVAVVALLLVGFFWEDRLLVQWALAYGGQDAARLAMAGHYVKGDQLLARNPARARSWIARAARSGSGEAQMVLACMALGGHGQADRPDPVTALTWARIAGRRGITDGNLLTGEILLSHPELAQPGEKAQSYFDAALPGLLAQARQGDAQALFSVGLQKIRGHGLPPDTEGGLRMLLQAQRKGLQGSQGLTVFMVRSQMPEALAQRVEASLGLPPSAP